MSTCCSSVTAAWGYGDEWGRGSRRGWTECQSFQIYYTPPLSGIHTAETSARSNLNQAQTHTCTESHTMHPGSKRRGNRVRRWKRGMTGPGPGPVVMCWFSTNPPTHRGCSHFRVLSYGGWPSVAELSLHTVHPRVPRRKKLADEWRKVGQEIHRCVPSSSSSSSSPSPSYLEIWFTGSQQSICMSSQIFQFHCFPKVILFILELTQNKLSSLYSVFLTDATKTSVKKKKLHSLELHA